MHRWAVSIIVFAAGLWGQSSADFEVAAVKRSKPLASALSGLRFPSPGRFEAAGVTLKQIIRFAYGVRDFQLSGGPGWTETETFDIAGKAAESATSAQMRLMLQTLLAERFHLTLRRETSETSTFHLVVAKNGPRLGPNLDAGPGDKESSISGRGPGVVDGRKASMTMLVNLLTIQLGTKVEDHTSLGGKYDFRLTWAPDQFFQAGRPGGPDANETDTGAPSLFTALQEQLGLKLEPSKDAVEVLVIMSAEKPTEN
ncbi:MAG TPA: TIGR03435 family protein [Bryobacteraceae bacterium]|jgi:uncharacterized protein (TIGR03435 family)